MDAVDEIGLVITILADGAPETGPRQFMPP